MKPLLAKELRSAWPFLALVFFFAALNWVFVLLAEYPDQQPLSKLLGDDNRTNTQVVTFLMAFALAAGLLVREQDEGTLGFLDALPVSRTRVFLAKVLVALGVLWFLPLCDFAFNATFHALSRTSLATRFHWDLLVTALVLDLAACVIYLGIGLALSFLRRYSLLVLGLLVWGYVLLREVDAGHAPLLNIFTLGDLVIQGQTWLVPWTKLAVQLGLAAVCFAVAWVAFQWSGDRAQRLAGRVRAWRGGTLLAGVVTVLVGGVWIGLLVYWGATSGADAGPKVTYAPWATARAGTERYQFLYPDNRGDALRPLLEGADNVEARVRSFLGGTPLDSIVVDMTSIQPRHAGQAYWRKVRMNLPYDTRGERGQELLAVLAHETTHLYIDDLSGARISDDFNSTRFFHEGLATFVEHHLFGGPGKLEESRRVAAVLRARDEVKLEELVDDTRLRVLRDPDVVYPLGEAFVAALVQRYGSNAPGRVLKAFARPNAPKGLAGFALWQDTFQAAGFNWTAVTDGFFALLDAEVTRQRAWADRLPRLQGAVEQGGGTLTVQARHEGDAPGRVLCRFRPRADTEDRFYEMAHDSGGMRFEVEAGGYPERSFWYQLGWHLAGASQPVYEPWVEVRRAR